MKKQHIIPITKPTLEPYKAYEAFFRESIESGQLTTGKHGAELEKKVEKYLRVKHCVAVSSCTSGLMLVMKGLGLTGEVIVPSFTFSASGHALIWNGLTPVFADIDPKTFTLDPKAVEKLITAKTSAILAVHPFGVVSDVQKLEALAKKYKLKLIFDAAHAFGSEVNGIKVGNFGDAEVFSCSPIKLLTAGEGGLVVTNNPDLAQFCRLGRNYGDDGTNNTLFVGLSARMSEFHSAIALRSLAQFPKNFKARRAHASHLIKGFLKIEPRLHFQSVPTGTTTSYYILSVFIDKEVLGYSRDELHDYFKERGIMTRKYFHPVLHKQTAYKEVKSRKGNLSITERVSDNVLALPLYSHISKEDMNRVISTFKEFTDTIRTRNI